MAARQKDEISKEISLVISAIVALKKEIAALKQLRDVLVDENLEQPEDIEAER
ncbi:hypothetical protein [Mucilaginibacter sp.]|uniref:hypothetical protein n=1 Tax=Mucilaginibacter sp. TaxID=1882438 RepID=UPI0025F4FEFA|nr:hypothetical protein [Mucilaginibacter sp.]